MVELNQEYGETVAPQDIPTRIDEVCGMNHWTMCEINGLLYPKVLAGKLRAHGIPIILNSDRDIITVNLSTLSPSQREFLINHLKIILTKLPEDGIEHKFTVSVIFRHGEQHHEFRTIFTQVKQGFEKIRAAVRTWLEVQKDS